MDHLDWEEPFFNPIEGLPVDESITTAGQLHQAASPASVQPSAPLPAAGPGPGLVGSPYSQRLRSYSSFPATAQAPPSTTSSDATTSSQAGDPMDGAYIQSLSDGAGSDQCRRVRRQVRRRMPPGGNGRALGGLEVRSRPRAYSCDVCRQTFPSPQSLGGHKNLHKNKGRRASKSSSRGRGARDQHQTNFHVGESAQQGTSGGDVDGVPSPIFRGVRCREGKKWVSEIRPPGSEDKWWLGTFPSAEQAAQAYDVALCYFKSETELNFERHDLCQNLTILPDNLSNEEFAHSLRDMVRRVSEQIIADRHRNAMASLPEGAQLQEASGPVRPLTPTSSLPEPGQPASSSRPSASDDSCTTEAATDTAMLEVGTSEEFNYLQFLSLDQQL